MKEHTTNTYKDTYEDIYDTEEYVMEEFEELFTPADKKAGIITSLIMIALGGLAAFVPIPLGIGIGFVATAGLGVYGVYQIVAYLRVQAERRNGWTLANGILLVLFSVFMLWGSLGNAYGSLQLISVLTFTIGFLALSSGIDQITSFFVLQKKAAAGTGWILAGGILNLVVSAFMIVNPVLSWFSLSFIWGIYFMISGVALLAESLSGRSGMHCSAY